MLEADTWKGIENLENSKELVSQYIVSFYDSECLLSL